MAHIWDDLVLGGLDIPKVFIVSDNLCSNPYFDLNSTGWTGASLSRVLNSDAYNDYMGRIYYTSTLTYVEYQYDFGASIANKIFLLAFRVKTGVTFKVTFVGSSGFVDETISASSTIKRVVVQGTASGQTGNIIKIRIYGTNVSGDGDLYFDDVKLMEVYNTYTFSQPQTSSLKFIRDNTGQNELENGMIQEFNIRFRPVYEAWWDYMSSAYETFRQRITANNLFCMPHQDVGWGFFCKWNGDLERQYSFDKFFGHKSGLMLNGTELIYELPEYKAGTGDLYVSEEEIIII